MKWSPISGLIIWAKGLNSLYWKLIRKFQTTESFIFGVFGNLALAFLIVVQGAINSQIVCHQNALPTDPEFTDYRFIEDFVSQYCWNGGKIGGVEGVRFWFVSWCLILLIENENGTCDGEVRFFKCSKVETTVRDNTGLFKTSKLWSKVPYTAQKF